jgi:hypothetical protein
MFLVWVLPTLGRVAYVKLVVRPPMEIEEEDLKSTHHKERFLKRKRNAEAADQIRQEFLAGEWDGYACFKWYNMTLNGVSQPDNS